MHRSVVCLRGRLRWRSQSGYCSSTKYDVSGSARYLLPRSFSSQVSSESPVLFDQPRPRRVPSSTCSDPIYDQSRINLPEILSNVKLGGFKTHSQTENDTLRRNLTREPGYRNTFSSSQTRVALHPRQMTVIRADMLVAKDLPDIKSLIDILSSGSQLPSINRRTLCESEVFLIFAEILSDRLKNCTDLTFADVESLLQSFHRYRFDQLNHNFLPASILRIAIDAKCTEIYSRLSREEAFMLSDLWYLSAASRIAKFPLLLISQLTRNISPLQPHELVRLLLAMCFQRSAETEVMLQIERALLPHMHSFAEPELAVICAGFFKTQTTPSSEFVDKVLSRLLVMDSDGYCSEIGMTMFAKFLTRYALPAQHEQLRDFLFRVKPYISQLSVTSLAHLTAIQEVTRHVDEDFLHRVCEKMAAKLPDVRVKDVAKLLKTCNLVNFRVELGKRDFFEMVREFMEKKFRLDEASSHPSKFVEAVSALALAGVFSKQLLDIVSSSEFLKHYRPQPISLLADEDLLRLHYAVELEFPDYRFPLLSEPYLQTLVQNEASRAGRVAGPMTTAVTSLFTALQTLLSEEQRTDGRKSVALISALPYTEPILVVRLNGLTSIPLPTEMLSVEDAHLCKRPSSDGTCFAISYHPWWNYMSPNHTLTGFQEMKLRHLKLLGYQVICVEQTDMQQLSFMQKVMFLRDKLFFEQFDVAVPRYVQEKAQVPRVLCDTAV